MEYYLKIKALGNFPKVSITAEQYNDIELSKIILDQAMALEENLDLILSNYYEFEKEALEISLSDAIYTKYEYEDFYINRLKLNQRLSNLLSSIRLYLDNITGHVQRIMTDGEISKCKIKKSLSKEYDLNFPYRFMEALRNYVQHNETPVHSVTLGSKHESKESRTLVYELYFATQKERISKDGKFKKSVLLEMPQEVDLKESTRSYIQSIGKIHQSVRTLIELKVVNAKSTFESMIKKYKVHYKEKAIGLFAYRYSKDLKEDTLILLEWSEVREKLIRKNSNLSNIANQYVTNRIKLK